VHTVGRVGNDVEDYGKESQAVFGGVNANEAAEARLAQCRISFLPVLVLVLMLIYLIAGFGNQCCNRSCDHFCQLELWLVLVWGAFLLSAHHISQWAAHLYLA
jgi:hypothetical protein